MLDILWTVVSPKIFYGTFTYTFMCLRALCARAAVIEQILFHIRLLFTLVDFESVSAVTYKSYFTVFVPLLVLAYKYCHMKLGSHSCGNCT